MSDLLILNYHGLERNVGEYAWEEVEQPYVLATDTFEAQLDLVGSAREPLSGSEALKAWLTSKVMPPSSYLVTFDDGHISHYTHALEVLKKRNLKGIFFISAGLVGKPSMMDWSQIQTLIEHGHEIGSHGFSHTALKDLSAEELRHEVEESKKLIEKKLKTQVKYFSVPLGFYNQGVKDAAIAAGYESIFTSEFGLNDLGKTDGYALRRVALKRHVSEEEFKRWAHGNLGVKKISEKIKSTVRRMLPTRIYDHLADVKRKMA